MSEIVSWEDELAELAKEEVASTSTMHQKMSISNGVLKIGDSVVKDGELPCIVIASVNANRYYPGRFTRDAKGAESQPVCFSHSVDKDTMVPHPNSSQPQSKTCGECPMNEFGSSPTGGGKACKNTKVLAILPGGAMESVDTLNESDTFTLNVPVTSVKNWGKYVSTKLSVLKRPAM